MNTPKKILNIALKVATWVLVAVAALMMIFTIITVTTVDKNERIIFGYRYYIVKSDSMSLSDKNADLDIHFNAGDIVVIKNLDDHAKRKLKAGDIIAFMSTNSDNYGETVTHMIREVKNNFDGELLGYVTYGTNTGVNDEELVDPSYVLGIYSGKLSGVGKFFAFLKSTTGYIVCIFVPFALLIAYNGANVIRLLRKRKRDQAEEFEAEKKQLETERAENQRMMQELMELKAQLAKTANEGGNTATNDSAEKPTENTATNDSAEKPTENTATNDSATNPTTPTVAAEESVSTDGGFTSQEGNFPNPPSKDSKKDEA